MNIRIITASAGSGKTTKLSNVLDEEIGAGRVRPDAVIATTFTRQAAAELIERARSRLLANGRGREAHQLLAARIGTVNAVCGSLVSDFAFELGLSPALRVLDEGTAELEQKRALVSVVSAELADELYTFRRAFDEKVDWRQEVRKLIEAARANGLDADALRACAVRSNASLDACLGPVAANGDALDAALLAAIDAAFAAVDTSVDLTKTTRDYLDGVKATRRQLVAKRARWGDWATLSTKAPGAKSKAATAQIATAAARHREHPRLRAEMHRFTTLLLDVAAAGLAAYQAHKRELGVIDFVDQEALALELLRRPTVRSALEGRIDLVLIDEFQDTSPLQLAIFLELASLARESVWVGDQKQAIYGFRGTDPALMDAMLEALTSTSTDPDLVNTVVTAVGHRGPIESLPTSYRSRPALVDLTSELFARAFVHHGIPEHRTRLAPASTTEPPGLGSIVEYWPLTFAGRSNKEVLAASTAAGVRALLDATPNVRDRNTSTARPATAGDLAVLCRTNEQCQHIAEALSQLGIAAVVPTMRLLDTAEGQLVQSALRLWIDARDALAAAELARLVHYAQDLEGLVARALEAPGPEAFAADPLVHAILAARTAAPDLDPVAALTTIIDVTNLRELCAAWGNAPQRHANLDALRAHAMTYREHASARREAPSVVGLLAYFDEMVDDWGWTASRSDKQALLSESTAVAVATWHAAKGREWPLTVLFGLESLREPTAFGLHVESDATAFDLAAPLARRWLRFWPNPYGTSNQTGPIKDAYAASPEYAAVVGRTQREALRLLYVGWTRARDRVIFAAAKNKLLAGLLGTLVDLEPALIVEPANDQPANIPTTWAGTSVQIDVRPVGPAAAITTRLDAGEVTVGLAPRAYPPARQSPSTVEPVPCSVGAPILLGSRLPLRGAPAMNFVGDAVHAFLAWDHPERELPERLARAASLLRGYGVGANLDAADVVTAGSRLWTWLDSLGATRLHREWPVAERVASGTVFAGTADLIARTAPGFVLVDHKTFPGSLEAAIARVPQYSGQLATYAHAITAATGTSVTSTWIHLPVLGVMVPVQF